MKIALAITAVAIAVASGAGLVSCQQSAASNTTNGGSSFPAVLPWDSYHSLLASDTNANLDACMDELIAVLETKRGSSHILNHVNPPLQPQPLVADFVVEINHINGTTDLRTYRATQLPLFAAGATSVVRNDASGLDSPYVASLEFLSMGLLDVNRQPPLVVSLNMRDSPACQSSSNGSEVLDEALPRVLISLPTYVVSSFGADPGRPHYFIYKLGSSDSEASAGCWRRGTSPPGSDHRSVLACGERDFVKGSKSTLIAFIVCLASVAIVVFAFGSGQVLMSLSGLFIPSKDWRSPLAIDRGQQDRHRCASDCCHPLWCCSLFVSIAVPVVLLPAILLTIAMEADAVAVAAIVIAILIVIILAVLVLFVPLWDQPFDWTRSVKLGFSVALALALTGSTALSSGNGDLLIFAVGLYRNAWISAIILGICAWLYGGVYGPLHSADRNKPGFYTEVYRVGTHGCNFCGPTRNCLVLSLAAAPLIAGLPVMMVAVALHPVHSAATLSVFGTLASYFVLICSRLTMSDDLEVARRKASFKDAEDRLQESPDVGENDVMCLLRWHGPGDVEFAPLKTAVESDGEAAEMWGCAGGDRCLVAIPKDNVGAAPDFADDESSFSGTTLDKWEAVLRILEGHNLSADVVHDFRKMFAVHEYMPITADDLEKAKAHGISVRNWVVIKSLMAPFVELILLAVSNTIGIRFLFSGYPAVTGDDDVYTLSLSVGLLLIRGYNAIDWRSGGDDVEGKLEAMDKKIDAVHKLVTAGAEGSADPSSSSSSS